MLCFQFQAILNNLSQSFLQQSIWKIYIFSFAVSQQQPYIFTFWLVANVCVRVIFQNLCTLGSLVNWFFNIKCSLPDFWGRDAQAAGINEVSTKMINSVIYTTCIILIVASFPLKYFLNHKWRSINFNHNLCSIIENCHSTIKISMLKRSQTYP